MKNIINQKRELNYIQSKLNNLCYENIRNLKKFKIEFGYTLDNLKKTNIIKDYEINKVYSLYDSWSFIEKITWYWKIVLGNGRKELEKYIDIENFLISRMVNKKEDIYNFISEMLDEYYKKYHKWWMEYNPKSIIYSDLKICLNEGIEHITINGNITI